MSTPEKSSSIALHLNTKKSASETYMHSVSYNRDDGSAQGETSLGNEPETRENKGLRDVRLTFRRPLVSKSISDSGQRLVNSVCIAASANSVGAANARDFIGSCICSISAISSSCKRTTLQTVFTYL